MGITIIGDTTLDLVSQQLPQLPREDTETAATFTPKIGGQAAHCALGLAELGVDVTFITCLGSGEFDKMIISKLKKKKIRLIMGRSDASAMSIIIPTPGKRTILNQRGANEALTYSADIKKKMTAKYLFFGGLWHVPNVDVRLLREAKEKKMTTFMDVGYQQDHDAARLNAALPYVDYFFADTKELMLYTKTKNLEEALGKIPSKTVGIHLGKDGSASFQQGKLIKAPLTSKYAGETTGAGDYWNAGFIYGTMNGWPMKKRLNFANRVAIRLLKKNIHAL